MVFRNVHKSMPRLFDWAGVRPQIAVETGTWHGVRTRSFARWFKQVYTIDLSPQIFLEMSKQLQDLPHVTCMLGDSATLLPMLCEAIQEPVFWFLDAHWFDYPKEDWNNWVPDGNKMPLWQELVAIRQRPPGIKDIVVVDDRSIFGSDIDGGIWLDVTERSLQGALGSSRTLHLHDALALVSGES